MNGPQILAVIVLYRGVLEKLGVGRRSYPRNQPLSAFNPEAGGSALEHCHWMLYEIERLVRQGNMEEAFRYLGFAQSILWREHIYTLDELNWHNSPGWK
jgi:hypothetical protein